MSSYHLRGAHLLAATLSLLLAELACEPRSADPAQVQTGEAFYRGAQKRWAHRANTIEHANQALERFPGVELDVVFEDGAFDVRHDVWSAASGLSLEAYFQGVQHHTEALFWVDSKNLRPWNRAAASKRMAQLIKMHRLEGRVIVESQNARALQEMSERGIATSYWITHFDYDETDLDAYRDRARALAGQLATYRFQAISCHHRMVPFVRRYFSHLNVHLWTTGLNPKRHQEELELLAASPFVHVMLVSRDQ